MPKKPRKSIIFEIFTRLRDALPEPKSDLNYTNTYTLLVAVVMSAQSTDKGVNKATAELFKVIETPSQMIALGEAKLKEHIKTIGLYNSKAKNVIALSKMLVNHYDGAVPQTEKELVALPGVGRKTANVVLNIAFGHKTIAVDTHVYRLGRRLGLSRGKTPDAVEKDLLKTVPDEFLYNAHHWLILHGRYTCVARKPKCETCVINDLCPSAFKAK